MIVKNLNDIFNNGKFIFLQESKSILLLKGQESFKFINSISSNEVLNTKGKLSVSTLMLNNKGRLIFDVEVYSKSADSLFLLCNLSQKDELIMYLENYEKHFCLKKRNGKHCSSAVY